ncbi:MAG: hypothetical protein J0G28_02090 [Afipia sp.]|nr:hypothetical protein [Afipia sp.]OJW66111.1 MAG: hypothetical protein BGO65_03450 [Afipia sp. 64-13]
MTGAGKTDGNNDFAAQEPGELEALLPWHAAGTLDPQESRRVEEALARDPALARQYAAVREECAETVLLNESLGAPSTRALEKLFEAIDAEPARAAAPAEPGLLGRLGQFFAAMAPRTLAAAAIVGAFALVLQAGVIGTVLLKGGSGSFETASYQTEAATGPRVLVSFVPDARIADINGFLGRYQASIVSGPQAGIFRIQLGGKALSKEETAKVIERIRGEKIIGFAEATN